MKTLLVTQSNYIPWRGYFDLIGSSDEFIVLDDVQYTRRDWRNRNQIKTSQGLQWLTIPVASKGKYDQRIQDTETEGRAWAPEHWKTLAQHYKKAPCFTEVADVLEPLYQQAAGLCLLSEVNALFLNAVMEYLEIETPMTRSVDYFSLRQLDGFDASERLLKLCQAAHATRYISGPSAKNYMDIAPFQTAGIEVRFADYTRYPPYAQLHGDFIPTVSIVDVLFNCGKEARKLVCGFAAR